MVKFYDVIVKEKSPTQKYISELQQLEICLIWANFQKDYTKVNVMVMSVFPLINIFFKIIKQL